jgi:hypothetical protein
MAGNPAQAGFCNLKPWLQVWPVALAAGDELAPKDR